MAAKTKKRKRKLVSSSSFPKRLSLAGRVQVRAQQGGTEKIFLVANTGKPMKLDNFFDPVIVNMRGAVFDKQTTPIIADHDTRLRIGHSTEQLILATNKQGSINGRTMKGPLIAASGIRSSNMAIAQGFVDDAKAGFPFQVSIGADILQGKHIPDGDSVRVNGRTWEGPLILANRIRIRELSITVLGADNDSSATIAAKAKLLEDQQMSFNAFVKSLGLDPTKLTAEQRTALKAQYKLAKAKARPKLAASRKPHKHTKANDREDEPRRKPRKIHATVGAGTGEGEDDLRRQRRRNFANESLRVDNINAAATRFASVEKIKVGSKEYTMSTLKAKAIRDGWSADQFELHLLRADYPQQDGPAIHSISRDLTGEQANLAMQASILRYSGVPNREANRRSGRDFGLEVMFKPEVLEASHQRQYQVGGSIQALLDLQIRAAGGYYAGSDRSSSEFVGQAIEAYSKIKASGFSTLNIVNILENVMHKSSLAAFEAVEAVWRFLCGRKPLNDFKPHALYRLDFAGHFKKVATDGELKHISMVDTKKTIQAETYGAMLTIDRKTIKNDDLGLILDQARGLGTLGAQRIEESVLVLLLSNPGSFFSSGNSNLITGGGTALSVTSLSQAKKVFRDQVVNGKPVSVSPVLLLTGTTLEETALRLWAEEKLAATGDTDALVFFNNPHKGMYRPFVSPYLDNTSVTDQDGAAISGQSATQWFLGASPSAPQGSALVIGFMDGRETPFFDEAETQFNIPGGLQFRSYLDWGVAMHIHQMMLQSAGA